MASLTRFVVTRITTLALNKYTTRLSNILFLIFLGSSIAWADIPFSEGDATMSSFGVPHIPEPMLFDLVRPLGASKGELEVNTLVQHGLSQGHIEWAPEIEYAFADGYAVELELPAENSQLLEYKMAVQGTLGTLLGNKMIHGWQAIGIRDRLHGGYSADLLYLNGATLPGPWSTFNMVGVRRNNPRLEGGHQVLLNNNLFYDRSRRLTFGLEMNHEAERNQFRSRITPQAHYDLNSKMALQVGAGPSWLERQGTIWSANWRLVYTY